jgi:hypothetical protein
MKTLLWLICVALTGVCFLVWLHIVVPALIARDPMLYCTPLVLAGAFALCAHLLEKAGV